MPAKSGSPPKLLFAISQAFGELFNAMYLVAGCSFQTVFVLREPWFSLNRSSLNRTSLPGPVYLFEGVDSLLTVIERENPDVVFLFSGYLYVSDSIMDFAGLDRLLKHLRSKGIATVTSDPFLGIQAGFPLIRASSRLARIMSQPLRRAGFFWFRPEFNFLESVPHLYVVDPDETRIRTLSFFNPRLGNGPGNADLTGGFSNLPVASGGPDGIPAQPYWLFILGGSDYELQVKRDGADYFHFILTGRLGRAIDQGRGAVLIAPEPCIAVLEANPLLQECVLIRYCDYWRYMAILFGAEHVFYWNLFSASVLARISNRQPVHFFARGHLPETSPRMFRKGMDRYYGGAEVTCLDPADRLDCSDLENLAHLQEERLFTPILRNLKALPSPEALVAGLLQNRPLKGDGPEGAPVAA